MKKSKEQNADNNAEQNKKGSKPVKYNAVIVILRLILSGLAALIVCVIGGVWITHGIGTLFNKWGANPDYFADYLGGAIGLTVGFALDKYCIERINRVFACRRLVIAICHELDNIRHKDKDNKSHVYVPKGNEQIEVLFDENGNVTTDISGCGINFIQELILDNVVTSAETMSLISNLPLAEHYKNEFIDFLGIVHRRIVEYVQSVKEAERNAKEVEGHKEISPDTMRKLLVKRRELNEEIEKFEVRCKYTIWTVKV